MRERFRLILSGFDRRLRRFNARLGRTFRRYRSIVLLFTDGIGGNQRFVTRQIRIRFGKRCLCRCQLRARAFQTCFISGTVDLIQRLPGADITAFLEQAFWMMPPTWARTSAVRSDSKRPGNSTVNATVCGWTVTTPTTGAGLPDPQAARPAPRLCLYRKTTVPMQRRQPTLPHASP